MMKQKLRLDRNNVLRPTPGDPWDIKQHHWNTVAKKKTKKNQKKKNRWTPVGQATDKKLRPQPTKINSFMSGHHCVWRPTHRRAIKEGSKVINRDWVKH